MIIFYMHNALSWVWELDFRTSCATITRIGHVYSCNLVSSPEPGFNLVSTTVSSFNLVTITVQRRGSNL